MIIGVGIDLVAIERIERVWQRHHERFARHVLTPAELTLFDQAGNTARWLAKRWAAKEAFAKACGTGMRGPMKWSVIGVDHDDLGRPFLVIGPFVQAWLNKRGITAAHLSITDERSHAAAVVILESSERQYDLA